MSIRFARTLFWAPRILSMLLIAFLSLFALDVFGDRLGFWQTLMALVMHLMPSFVLIAILLLAWRREWIGAIGFGVLGMFYSTWVLSTSRPIGFSARLSWTALIGVPAFVVAGLFLANWLRRHELPPAWRRS